MRGRCCLAYSHALPAPAGKHVLHAYLPASEPYEIWAGLDRRSEEYARLKEARSQVGAAGTGRGGGGGLAAAAVAAAAAAAA
jgi:hypothetical protein